MELNKIYNESCIDTMSKMNDGCANVILTSPPYNMTSRKGGYADTGRYDVYKDFLEENEYISFTLGLFHEFDRIVANDGVVIYNFNYSIENPSLPYKIVSTIVTHTNWDLVDTICWKKTCGLPFPANKHRLSRNWEFVWVFARKGMLDCFFIDKEIAKIGSNGQKYYKVYYNYLEAPNNDKETRKINQATFSSVFVSKLLSLYAPVGGVIYDPFIGTGTTAIGALKCGKELKFIGSEISPMQCVYANNRIDAYRQQIRFDI